MTGPEPPPTTAPSRASTFPGEDDLCESCGYPLKGLAPGGGCPECGSPVDASHPRHRDGPAFATSRGPVSYLKTAARVACAPKTAFRGLRLRSGIVQGRLFLFVNAVAAATLWAICAGPTIDLLTDPTIDLEFFTESLMGWPVVLVAVPILTYIEVLGVTWFSRKRGWRVPLRHAEQVACYASVGWMPGAVLFGLAMHLGRRGTLEDLWATLGGNPVYGPDAAWIAVFLAAIVAMLGFETLVWVGVRQVKFANTHARPATRPGASENAAPARRA